MSAEAAEAPCEVVLELGTTDLVAMLAMLDSFTLSLKAWVELLGNVELRPVPVWLFSPAFNKASKEK